MAPRRTRPHSASPKVVDGQLDLFAAPLARRLAQTPRVEPRKMPVKDALRRYGIGRTKLYELLASGALKASKLGAKTLIDVETADSFFSGLPDYREQV